MLEDFFKLSVFGDDFLAGSLRLSHLVHKDLDRGLYLPKLFLGLGKLTLQLSNSLLQSRDLTLKVLLVSLFFSDCLFVRLVKMADCVGVILLFLGELFVEVLV
jgi:hypothetical protein